MGGAPRAQHRQPHHYQLEASLEPRQVSALGLVSTPQGIDHIQSGDPAPMAESFRVENAAMAADRGLGDQGVEPAELLPDRQLVGIKDQMASDPTSSKPAGAAKSSLIYRSRRGGSDIRRAIERNQAQRLVSMITRISSVLVRVPPPGFLAGAVAAASHRFQLIESRYAGAGRFITQRPAGADLQIRAGADRIPIAPPP